MLLASKLPAVVTSAPPAGTPKLRSMGADKAGHLVHDWRGDFENYVHPGDTAWLDSATRIYSYGGVSYRGVSFQNSMIAAYLDPINCYAAELNPSNAQNAIGIFDLDVSPLGAQSSAAALSVVIPNPRGTPSHPQIVAVSWDHTRIAVNFNGASELVIYDVSAKGVATPVFTYTMPLYIPDHKVCFFHYDEAHQRLILHNNRENGAVHFLTDFNIYASDASSIVHTKFTDNAYTGWPATPFSKIAVDDEMQLMFLSADYRKPDFGVYDINDPASGVNIIESKVPTGNTLRPTALTGVANIAVDIVNKTLVVANTANLFVFYDYSALKTTGLAEITTYAPTLVTTSSTLLGTISVNPKSFVFIHHENSRSRPIYHLDFNDLLNIKEKWIGPALGGVSSGATGMRVRIQ